MKDWLIGLCVTISIHEKTLSFCDHGPCFHHVKRSGNVLYLSGEIISSLVGDPGERLP